MIKLYEKISKISKDNLEKIVKGLIDKHKTNFKGVGQPLRIALTGSKFGPGIYDIILSLDKNETTKNKNNPNEGRVFAIFSKASHSSKLIATSSIPQSSSTSIPVVTKVVNDYRNFNTNDNSTKVAATKNFKIITKAEAA